MAKIIFNKTSKVFVIFGIILIICALAYLLNLYKTSNDTNNNTYYGDSQAVNESIEANEPLTLAEIGDIEQALELVNNRISQATNYTDLYILYNQKANIYIYDKNYSEAISNANKALSISINSYSYVILGDIALGQDSNNLAIEYYEKALSLEDQNDPRSNYWDYYNKIEQVKAGQ
jgi:tetratricopeptide (TPR) repeat protein